MGCDVAKCRHVPSEGIAAFMRRAVLLAEKRFREAFSASAASVPASGSRGDSVTELVRAVRDEELRVHVNVEEAVRVCLLTHTVTMARFSCLRLLPENNIRQFAVSTFPHQRGHGRLGRGLCQGVCVCVCVCVSLSRCALAFIRCILCVRLARRGSVHRFRSGSFASSCRPGLQKLGRIPTET